MRCLKRKLKNQWNFVCKLIAMLLVSMLWTPLLLILWKSLILGKLVLMSMIFLVPQAWRRKFTLMILCLLYMMIVLFSVHLLLRRTMITICLLYLMIMVMRIIMISILFSLLPLQLIRMTMLMWRVLILLCIMIRIFQVMVILWTLSMMLLEFIMRVGNMVICISIILSFPSLCLNF